MTTKPFWIVDTEASQIHKRQIVVSRHATWKEADRDASYREKDHPGRYQIEEKTNEKRRS